MLNQHFPHGFCELGGTRHPYVRMDCPSRTRPGVVSKHSMGFIKDLPSGNLLHSLTNRNGDEKPIEMVV